MASRKRNARPVATGTGGDTRSQRRRHRSEDRPEALAAAWLERRYRVKPLLAETIAWHAGLGGLRR
jgi:hypothetical protein